ncbi:hypothetical protein G7074_18035 [Pedobacter sp. HDW13]|uniref:DUF6291 domain-containing protein n=1 Tax=Pedobacter sp. HDW13 TaxID=2714940 RepID=UPI00140C7D9A|nr:DUF6291 domain-containing protein [Pedobacter sp. HDW13]QIL40999.1 hypothetical protein G7074_18035 [Pedobacter sp. HDW13]
MKTYNYYNQTILMAENKRSFLLYADLLHTVKKMPLEQVGKLLIVMLEYVNDLDPVINDLMIELVFEPIKQQMKRDLVKWEAIKEKRSNAGKASAESKKAQKELQQMSTNSTLVDTCQHEPTKSTVNDTVIDTVNDTVINDIIKTSVVPTESIDPQKFIDAFNDIAGRKFRVTQKIKDSLKARLKDYTKKEIFKAMKNAHKDPYHKENNFQYLTPEFILRPDKIERFLNYDPAKDKSAPNLFYQTTN